MPDVHQVKLRMNTISKNEHYKKELSKSVTTEEALRREFEELQALPLNLRRISQWSRMQEIVKLLNPDWDIPT